MKCLETRDTYLIFDSRLKVESSITQNTASENIRRRSQALLEHTFSTDFVIGEKAPKFRDLFESDDVIQPFLASLEKYEERVFKSHDVSSMQMRQLLKCDTIAHTSYANLPPQLAAQLSQLQPSSAPTVHTHDEYFSLVAAYSLVERWLEHTNPGVPNCSKIVPKRLEKAMLDTIKMPHFDQLANIPQLLQQARRHGESIQSSLSTQPTSQEGLISHHLNTIAFHHIRSEVDGIIDNFRMAAFNLAYKLKGNTSSTGRLPDLPDKAEVLRAYAGETNATKDDEYRVRDFIEKTKPAQMRLALELAETISPAYLLTTGALRKHHKIGRENLLKICTSLGNQKPPALRELEIRIWSCLIEIGLEGKDARVALHELVRSDIWTKFELLPLSDPAASFFQPIDHTPRISETDTASSSADVEGSRDAMTDKETLEDETVRDETQEATRDPGEETAHTANTEAGRPTDQNDEDEPGADADGDEDDQLSSTENPGEPSNADKQDTPPGPNEQPITKKASRKSTRIKSANKSAGHRKEYKNARPHAKARKTRKYKSKAAVEEEEEDTKPQLQRRGKWYQPIDVDLFVDNDVITLDVSEEPEKVATQNEYTVYGAEGRTLKFTPNVHTPSILKSITSLVEAAESHYKNGKPIHIEDPDNSGIYVTSFANLLKMGDAKVQEIFRTKHIYMTDCPTSPLTFKQALRKLGSLVSLVDIQDQSISAIDKNDCIRQGRVKQILECVEKPNGKILNALQFPMPMQAIERSSYSSDAHALHETVNDPSWRYSIAPPTKDVRWAAASVKGAYHGWHVDASGAGTGVQAEVGGKWWFLATPIPGSDFRPFSSTNLFLQKDYDVDGPNVKLWNIEAILIEPGTRLLMRPNTPHAVVTLDHSVTMGSHFFMMSTIQDTCYGIMHTFVMEKLVTNTSHNACLFLIRQMIIFVHGALVKGTLEEDDEVWDHVPSLKTMESLLDLLTLCNLGIMHNVIDLDTYTHSSNQPNAQLSETEREEHWKHDCNAVTLLNRRAAMHVRALARDLISWLDANYEIRHPDISDDDDGSRAAKPSDIARQYLGMQCSALLHYKIKAVKGGNEGASNCTPEMLRRQIAGIFPLRDDLFRVELINALEHEHQSMCFPDTLVGLAPDANSRTVQKYWDFEIRKTSARQREPINLRVAGLTALDIRYFEYTSDEDITEELHVLEDSGELVTLTDEYDSHEVMEPASDDITEELRFPSGHADETLEEFDQELLDEDPGSGDNDDEEDVVPAPRRSTRKSKRVASSDVESEEEEDIPRRSSRISKRAVSSDSEIEERPVKRLKRTRAI